MIKEMLDGCWEACFYPDPVNHEPFIANAIIANPPSFAHVHCAQALGVPVHIMFTMPWTATKAFPHPLANFNKNNIEPSTANWLSYGVVEMMTWQGWVLFTCNACSIHRISNAYCLADWGTLSMTGAGKTWGLTLSRPAWVRALRHTSGYLIRIAGHRQSFPSPQTGVQR